MAFGNWEKNFLKQWQVIKIIKLSVCIYSKKKWEYFSNKVYNWKFALLFSETVIL